MAFFRAKTPLDRAFEVSIFLKGLDGLFETLGGIFFLFVRPEHVSQFIERITAPELSTDPDNFIANHLLHWSQTFTEGTALFAAAYLLSHGLVKLLLVAAIFKEHLWAYTWLIIVTAGFIAYQLYYIIFIRPTFGYIFLTVFDALVIFLTVKEHGKQKERLLRLQHEREEENAG